MASWLGEKHWEIIHMGEAFLQNMCCERVFFFINPNQVFRNLQKTEKKQKIMSEQYDDMSQVGYKPEWESCTNPFSHNNLPLMRASSPSAKLSWDKF